MRLHRFYIDPAQQELKQNFWINEPRILNQWLKVLRLREGDEVVLFDGAQTERLYKISRLEPNGIHLELVTEFERKLPPRHVYLFWSLLKKDKNEWVVQKATELGVSNFVPIVAARSEKTGFNKERAEKIAIEAAEQCGRSDIPHIRDVLSLEEALNEYRGKVDLLVAEGSPQSLVTSHQNKNPVGVFIGPEGGWSQTELDKFGEYGIGSLHLGNLTLRAETAAVIATAKLLQYDN